VERVAVEISVRDDVTGAVGFRAGVKPGDVLVLGSARATLAEGAPVRVAPSGADQGSQAQPAPESRAPAETGGGAQASGGGGR
jgi:hypothetical protein